MAAPEFVPNRPTDRPRSYESAPRRMDPWMTDRPGDVVGHGHQPDLDAGRMGAPGPDQGYVLKLLPVLRDDLHLTDGERRSDVEAAGVAVALKRASIFGRAPVIHDLRVAYTVWGLLDPSAPAELVELRRSLFEGVHHTAAHYPELRAVVDRVPASTLRLTPAAVADGYAADWRSLLTD